MSEGTAAAPLLMVVEDDPDVSEALIDALVDAGYRVVAACDGLDALERLGVANEAPQLILLDLMMPRLDGWGFLERQRADVRLREIPTVLLTARGGVGIDVGVEVVRKPVHIDTLLGVVERFRRAPAPA